MVANMREKGHEVLDTIPEDQLASVVRLLELVAKHGNKADVEPEELWLLATGELKKMDDEIADARPIDDWRKYLDEI
jgi:hypothetical protein